jgi:hypothetical protein
MHLVTEKVKVDSSLLIKIIVSIKVILVFGRGFLPLAKPKYKTPYYLRTKEKRSKKGHLLCTSFNEGLPTSCNKATVILHESLSLDVVNCEYHVFQIPLTERTVYSRVSYLYHST